MIERITNTPIHKPISFALCGIGHIGMVHAEQIMGNQEARLRACCDADISKASLAKDFDTPFFTSIDEMLRFVPGIDIVSVCSPNGLHHQHALAALRNGCHVMCEKPMAINTSQADAMMKAAHAAGRHIFCVMQNRFSPISVWLKQLVDAKKLGDIYFVQINCFWNRDSRYYRPDGWRGTTSTDGGTLFTQFSHFIDMVYWLFGDIFNLGGRFFDFNHQQLTNFEDTGFITFDFVGGGSCSFNYSTSVCDKNLESSMTIVGSHGTVKVAGQYMNEVLYCNTLGGDVRPPAPFTSPNNHSQVIQNAIDVVRGKATIAATAQEGAKIVETIEKIYQLRDMMFPKTLKQESGL